MAKRRIELEKKVEIMRRHLLKQESITDLSLRFHISRDSIYHWKRKVIAGMENSLLHLPPRKKRSKVR